MSPQPPKPPPPPPARASLPTKPKLVNREQVDELANLAMLLREEQVQARIVHYKAELETSPELDAITAQVVAQLKQLQSKATQQNRAPDSRDEVAAQQVKTLAGLLARVFRADGPSVLVEHNIKRAARRVTRLFFESELHEQLAGGGDKLKTIHHAEQGVFYVLHRYERRIHAELEGFVYADDEVRERTFDLFAQTTNDLRVAFLSRRSPELKRFLSIFHEILLDFFQQKLPPHLPALAAEVIADSGSAGAVGAVGYRVPHTAFEGFRQVFERRFLSLLVGEIEAPLVARLSSSDEAFREETVAFAQAAQIYSDVCALVCDAAYDFLCNEGYLDLPVDWRNKPGAQ